MGIKALTESLGTRVGARLSASIASECIATGANRASVTTGSSRWVVLHDRCTAALRTSDQSATAASQADRNLLLHLSLSLPHLPMSFRRKPVRIRYRSREDRSSRSRARWRRSRALGWGVFTIRKQRLNLSEFLIVDVTLTAHFFEVLSEQFLRWLVVGVGIAQF